MKVIRKAKHVRLKALARGEQFILAARHRGKRLRGILSHRLSRGSKFLDEISARAPLVSVATPRDIQLLRNIWRKREGVDQSVSHSFSMSRQRRRESLLRGPLALNSSDPFR